MSEPATDPAPIPSATSVPPPATDTYPANTPVDQMTQPQQLAYYKAQSAKHEGRATKNYATLRELGITDDDTAAQIKEKLARHDALEHDLMSDKDKAVADTKKSTRAEADGEYRPKLVRAEFKAAAAGRIEAEQLAAILEPLDLTKFLTSSGDVDDQKVAAYVEQVAPGKGIVRQGAPSTFGLGHQRPATAAPGEQGRLQAEKRFGIKAS